MADQIYVCRIIAWGNNCRGLGSKSDSLVPFSHEFLIFLCLFCAKKRDFRAKRAFLRILSFKGRMFRKLFAQSHH